MPEPVLHQDDYHREKMFSDFFNQVMPQNMQNVQMRKDPRLYKQSQYPTQAQLAQMGFMMKEDQMLSQ